MFVPIILGSDKTTVSVATGQTEYWPIYGSIGNIHNGVRRAHGAGLVLIGFLPIPKSVLLRYISKNRSNNTLAVDRQQSSDPTCRQFRRQLFHSCLSKIFSSLRPGMEKPEVARCADGHYRRVIWGLGPYIADYPEQTLITCVVQRWCPRCVQL